MQKIMIVEDDEVISSILKKHLSKWNYEIYVAENFENKDTIIKMAKKILKL